MSKFKFILVSKNTDFKLNTTQVITEHHMEIARISNNSTILPIVYNREFENFKISEADFLVLMHADVNLDLKKFIDDIESVKGKYDVIGLCGTSVVNISQCPFNWWTSSNPTPTSKWGCVTHGELGNQMSFFSAHSPDVTDHEVACIDGLCMVFNRKAIESGLRFDEKLSFNCYDTQISLDAVMKYNLKLGVIVEKSLQHYSVGKQILTPVFLKDELELRKHFGFDIPKGSPLEQYVKSVG